MALTAQKRINDWCKRMTVLAKRYDYLMTAKRKKEKRASDEKWVRGIRCGIGINQ